MIGFSLSVGFLAGVAGPREDAWFQTLGAPDECLALLAGMGVRSIELRDVRAASDPALVAGAVRRVRAAGLLATLHLWLPRSPRAKRALESAAVDLEPKEVASLGHPAAVHGHPRNAFASIDDAIAATAESLVAFSSGLGFGAAVPALELCRWHAASPAGSSFAEIRRILTHAERQARQQTFGWCWDVGHGHANRITRGDPIVPPAHLITRAIHTHVHDVDANGRTHGPLVDVASPVADAIYALREGGYRGIYNLELDPSRWQTSPSESRELVEASIRTLTAMI